MFPVINHIDDLWPFVSLNVQIRQKSGPDGAVIVSYQVQDEDTFVGQYEDLERECRGITFNAEGKVIARTMHKFFNVGQREDVQPEKLRWQDVSRIMVKRDGSMVTPVLLRDGAFKCKTKNSFATKEAALADEVIARTQVGVEWLALISANGLTASFEITSAKYPIVLRYVRDELTLLHVRENVSGRYLTEREIIALASPFPLVENVMSQFLFDTAVPANLVSWEKLRVYALTAEKVEGVVIQFSSGEMVKVKTVWYCDLHHSVTFTRWRDIARTVVADKSDDLKSAFAITTRSIEPILTVERKIKATIEHASARAWSQVEEGRSQSETPKDMALRLKGHELFGQIMTTYRGGEVDWMTWYERNHLDADWSLEVVANDEEEVAA